MQITLTAVFQKVPSGYIGFVEELPGANTQGATLEEARSNLEEAIVWCWRPTGPWKRSGFRTLRSSGSR